MLNNKLHHTTSTIKLSCLFILLCSLLVAVVHSAITQYTINNVAGTGGNGFLDGNNPLLINMSFPRSIAIHPTTQELYFADTNNGRVRKIASNGVVSTVAGTGSTSSYNGDGILATNANLNQPYSIRFNAKAELIIADFSLCRIFKVLTNGTITTIAGNGQCATSGDGGLAVNARVNGVQGLFISPTTDEIYFAEYSGCVVRKIMSNGIVVAVAGNGQAIFSGDYIQNAKPTSAGIPYPRGVCVNSKGDIFIAESQGRIRKVSADSGVVSSISGNGRNNADGENLANANVYDLGNIYCNSVDEFIIMDDYRVRKVFSNYTVITLAGKVNSNTYEGNNVIGTAASLYRPSDLAISNQGIIYIVDTNNQRIRSLTPYPCPTGQSYNSTIFDCSCPVGYTTSGSTCTVITNSKAYHGVSIVTLGLSLLILAAMLIIM